MRPLHRRWFNLLLIILSAIAAGVLAIVGSAFGDGERVADLWVDAELGADQRLIITEIIDYDFGLQARRGIFRDVDGLDPDADVTVNSPTAPDEFVVFDDSFGASDRSRIRVGDPSMTIRGRHRYELTFPVDGAVRDASFGWDAIGTEWSVSIEKSTVRLRSAFELLDVECVVGAAGSWDPCEATADRPGVLVVSVGRLTPGQGVTLFASLGSPIDLESASEFLPSGPAEDPGTGTIRLGIISALAALAAGLAASRAIRRLGREQVHSGGAVAAAFGGPIDDFDLVDHRELAQLATITFAPPADLSATEGGVVFHEAVQKTSLSSWLIERAIADEIVIEGDDRITIRRGGAIVAPAWQPTLDKMFGQRESIDLSKYDKKFSSGWHKLERTLETWQSSSQYWDSKGQVTQMRVRAVATVMGAAGAILAALGGAASARWGAPWPVAMALGSALAGAAVASMIRSWELLVRSPVGSAAWIQVESFRRFLDGSEASHVENAAAMGRLREYTAWAVALGETRAWRRAVESTVADSPELQTDLATDLYLVGIASHISSAAATASTAPSSRGGGFSGGGVGGGGGGGGGGSW